MNKKFVIEISLFGVALIWALNFTVIKGSLNEIDPLSFNGLRFVFATLIIWIALWANGQKITIPKKDWLPLLGMGLLGNLLYQGLFIIGIDFTLAANTAVMLGTIPIWMALLSHIFTDEKLTIFKSAGVILAFAGVLFLVLGGDNPLNFSSRSFLGDLIVITAAIVWATYSILSKSFLKRYTPLQFSTITTSIGSIALFSLGLPNMLVIDWTEVSLPAYGGILYSGLLSVGVAYIIWNYGLKMVGAVHTAAFQNLVPVFGLLFGVILLNERLTLLQYSGSLLTIIGIVLTRWKRPVKKGPEPRVLRDG